MTKQQIHAQRAAALAATLALMAAGMRLTAPKTETISRASALPNPL
jgi:hypothetical protein